MKKQIIQLITVLIVSAMTLSAVPQWTADEFVGLADGDEIVVDSKLAGTSSITVISNTIGMKGAGHSKKPRTDIWISIEREGVPDIRIPLQNALKNMNANGSITIDLGVTFQKGDEIEIGQMRRDDDGKRDFHDFDLDAVTNGFIPEIDRGDYDRPGFNPAHGVDNYFQSYVDDDKGKYNGEFIWTFGDGKTTPVMPDLGGNDLPPDVPNTPSVSGQPLPGTIVTLLVGIIFILAVRAPHKVLRHQA